MKQLSLLLLLCSTLLAGGCRLLDDGVTNANATPTAPIPTPAATPASAGSTPEAVETALPVPATITLTVWTSPELAPQPDLAGGRTLAQQLNAFDNSHPDVRLSVSPKATSGQGGMLSYLRTGRTVAPEVLPDLILLPGNQLAEAAAQDLIYPLDNLLPAEQFDDLYPAAQEVAQIDGQYYGYPFALTNLRHLVYNATVITETLPTSWPALMAQETPPSLIMPAAGPVGASFALHYYLAEGGTLLNEAGQPGLDVAPLAAALTQIQQGVAANLLDPQSATTSSVEPAWQIFANSSTGIVMADAAYFLRQRAGAASDGYAFAPLPGPAGPLPPLVNSLVWAVSTPEPGRQALVSELIGWLADSENLGDWTGESYLLPARTSALATWPEADGYRAFLDERLEAARPLPAAANSALMLALSQATADVLLQLSTPQEAAEAAAAALQADT